MHVNPAAGRQRQRPFQPNQASSDRFNGCLDHGRTCPRSPDVSTRKTSAINLDPRIRGYNSDELNATANGMTELKTRMDIDSALSQIDPGVVDN